MGGKACKTGDLLARCMTEFGQHSDEGMGADWADAFDGAQALFLSFDRCIGLHKVSYLLLDLIDLGVDLNVIKKSGSWFSYNETKLGQGRDAVKQLLDDNPDLMEEIEARVKEAIAGKSLATA